MCFVFCIFGFWDLYIKNMDLHFGKRRFVFRIFVFRWSKPEKQPRKYKIQIRKMQKKKGFDFAF